MQMVDFQYGQEKAWGKVCDDMKAGVLSWAGKTCHVQMARFQTEHDISLPHPSTPAS